jgi:hypothetical protein
LDYRREPNLPAYPRRRLALKLELGTSDTVSDIRFKKGYFHEIGGLQMDQFKWIHTLSELFAGHIYLHLISFSNLIFFLMSSVQWRFVPGFLRGKGFSAELLWRGVHFQ